MSHHNVLTTDTDARAYDNPPAHVSPITRDLFDGKQREVDRRSLPAELFPTVGQNKDVVSTMATIRSYLNAKRHFIPTVLLIICVIFYLPYSYVAVMHAKSEQRQAFLSSPGFQKVGNRSHVVFSAYLDDRFPGEAAKVRIFGFKRKTDLRPLYCKLYFQTGRAMCLHDPAIELVLDPQSLHNHDIQCLFHCTIPDHVAEVPVAVTLASSTTCQARDHVVPVQIIRGDPDRKREVAVCFATPSRALDKTNEKDIVEIFELSKYFGASIIQMYNESISPTLLDSLTPYLKSGLLHMLPWRPGDTYLQGMAQSLIVNDCIYRNMATYKYVVFVDKDEIIVPSKMFNVSWSVMMKELLRQKPAVGAFWFKDTRHAPANGVTAKPVPADCPLSSLSADQLPRIYTHRFVSTSKKRDYHSQFIVDPSVVLYVNSQKRFSFLPGKSSLTMSREYGVGMHFLSGKEATDWTTTENFQAAQLLRVVKEVYNRLGYQNVLNLTGCI